LPLDMYIMFMLW